MEDHMSATDMLKEAIALHTPSQAWLARQTGLSLKHINMVVNGKDPLSVDVAIRIERAIPSLSAEDLMVAQARTQVRAARLKND